MHQVLITCVLCCLSYFSIDEGLQKIISLMLIIHSALVLVRIHFLCGSSLSTRVISVNGGGLPALRKAAYLTCTLSLSALW